MVKLFKWFAIRKERAEYEKARSARIHREEEGVLKEQLSLYKKDMFLGLCPFINFTNCNEKCIHFKDGKVFYLFYPYPGKGGTWRMKNPRCRLWK